MTHKRDIQRKGKPMGAEGHRKRMFEKLIDSDTFFLSKRDYLEILLYFPIKVKDTRDSAVSLMDAFNNDIISILNAPHEELCQMEGIGSACADFLNVAGEIVTRINDSLPPYPLTKAITNQVYDMFSDIREKIHGDELWGVYIDENACIADSVKIKSEFGMTDEKEQYYLLKRALMCRATSVIIVHVTEGLEVYPTAMDSKVMKHMEAALAPTNLTLADYYIMGGDEFIPMLSLEKTYIKK